LDLFVDKKGGMSMHKSITILVSLFVVLQGNLVWAELKSEQEGRQGELKAKEKAYQEYVEFQKSLSKGNVGRFQAVRMDDSAVFILDTKQAHLWVFGATGSGFHVVYGGQVYPGMRAGEIIDSSSLRIEKGQFFAPREGPGEKERR
jgi:hypothetical protein